MARHYRRPHYVRGHFRSGCWVSRHKRSGSIINS